MGVTIDRTSRILVVGAGIAGLCAALALRRRGYHPTVVERAPALRREGYMMDFYGTGWDVATRMGLEADLRGVGQPFEALEYVDRDGRPFLHLPLDTVRDAVRGRYTYLRRQDLERILFDRAVAEGVPIRFATAVRGIDQDQEVVTVNFEDGSRETAALVIGADGVHSAVRRAVFGPERDCSRYLGCGVAAFHAPARPEVGTRLRLHEEQDRIVAFYPTGPESMDATYVFRSAALPGPMSREDAIELLRRAFAGAGWIAGDVLAEVRPDTPLFFDSLTQITLRAWTQARVALIGDACGCLTLLAGQGSHIAMAAGYVFASELARAAGDLEVAFREYQRILRPAVIGKQREALRLSRIFMPDRRSRPWLRRLALTAMFSRVGIWWTMRALGSRSALDGYRGFPDPGPAA